VDRAPPTDSAPGFRSGTASVGSLACDRAEPSSCAATQAGGDLSDQYATRTGHAAASVSVVVPLQDEEQTVEHLLGCLVAQTHCPDEVILVDAGSRDRTVTLARSVSTPFPLRIVEMDRSNPGVARNLGVKATSSVWVAFTDGGVRQSEEWLEELLRVVQDGPVVAFGRYDPVCDSFFRQCAAMAYVPRLDRSGTRGPSVASCIVSRRIFDDIGGFPPWRASEDLAFIEALRQRERIGFAPRATVYWEIASSLPATFRRFAAYSFANLQAGRGRYWHLGVLRLYLMLGILMVSAAVASAPNLAGGAIPVFFLARATKAAVTKRGSLPFNTLSPSRITFTAAILAVIDLATVVGALKWLRSRCHRQARG
jgi:glycosyltransferase involved in cell wall biosynthesis